MKHVSVFDLNAGHSHPESSPPLAAMQEEASRNLADPDDGCGARPVLLSTTVAAKTKAVRRDTTLTKLLVVDDEPGVLRTIGKFASACGYEPLLARNGMEAVDLFSVTHHLIAAVVLDLHMPGMNGIEAFHQLKRIEPSIPVIFATGYGTETEIQVLRDIGAQGLLPKPFGFAEFTARLDKAVGDRIS